MATLKRKFMMPFSELSLVANEIIKLMREDITLFEERGVFNSDIDAFEALADDFKFLPTDAYYSGSIMLATDEKKKARKTAVNYVRKVTGYFEQKWGADSWQYKGLGIKDFVVARDGKFQAISRYVIETAEKEYSTLSAIGMKQADIDSLTAAVDLMDEYENIKQSKQAFRREKAEERTAKANELYTYLKQYCMIGKLIWEEKSNSRYEHYLVYRGVSKKRRLQKNKEMQEDSEAMIEEEKG